MSSTRPDIIYACSSLSSVQNALTHEYWDLLIKLCQYIKNAINYGILYWKSSSNYFKLIGYSDADWAGNPQMWRSVSGYVFVINGAPVSWSSKPQTIAAVLSTGSEFVALSRAVQQAV